MMMYKFMLVTSFHSLKQENAHRKFSLEEIIPLFNINVCFIFFYLFFFFFIFFLFFIFIFFFFCVCVFFFFFFCFFVFFFLFFCFFVVVFGNFDDKCDNMIKVLYIVLS